MTLHLFIVGGHIFSCATELKIGYAGETDPYFCCTEYSLHQKPPGCINGLCDFAPRTQDILLNQYLMLIDFSWKIDCFCSNKIRVAVGSKYLNLLGEDLCSCLEDWRNGEKLFAPCVSFRREKPAN